RNALRVLPDRVAQRLDKAWIVEQADVPQAQVLGHALGEAETRQGAGDHDAVVAGEDPGDLAGIAFRQQRHARTPFWCGQYRTPAAMCKPTALLVSALPS